MTEEEKAALAAQGGEVIESVVEIDPITKLEEDNARLIEERDNYKAVALKRLGKLPGDAEFLNGEGKSELSVEEQVKLILLEKEINANEKAKSDEAKRLARENSELRLALKNRPSQSIGGDTGNGGVVVKDNVLTEGQLISLRAQAARLKADPEKFIENFKKTLANQK